MYFDTTVIRIMVNVGASYITTFSDFSNYFKLVQGTVFDCDKKGDIYLAQERRVLVYSSDFQFKRYFELNLAEPGVIYALLVK